MPMAPSDKVLSDAIRNAVRRMFKGPERDNLTVNKVRESVESELHLEAGFLKEGSWKLESKNIVKTESDKLLQLEEAGELLPDIQSTNTPTETKSAARNKSDPVTNKKGVKRSSNGEKAKGQKRQKRDIVAVSDDEDEDSALTSIEDTPEEPEDSFLDATPEPKKAKKMSVVKQDNKGRGKLAANERNEKQKQATDTEVKLHISHSKTHKKTQAGGRAQGDGGDAPPSISGGTVSLKRDASLDADEAVLGSDSEMSVVLDEAPKRKLNSKPAIKGQSSNSISKSTKPPKATKHPPDLSPDEAELKTLQSQLAMCGVRKIWGFVLKDYGSDTKAKIRHLKAMLKDIGMDGRFSKQRAQEIKEARELQADLEDVKEGDAKWGMGRGARIKKIRKSLAEDSDEEEEKQDGAASKSKNAIEQVPARVAKAKMDLAFLGDESESDD